MLLVLSWPSRDAAPLSSSLLCAMLSNVAIMSLQIKLFPFITRLTKVFCLEHLVQFQKFSVTHLAVMGSVSIWFTGGII